MTLQSQLNRIKNVFTRTANPDLDAELSSHLDFAAPRMQDLTQRYLAGNLEKDPALLAEFTQFFDELFRDKSHLGQADFVVASAGFFKALDIPLLQGRRFDERDTIEAPHVALVNQSLAQQTWPLQDPIGRTIEFGNMDGDPRLLTIIGDVGDVRDPSLESAPPPTVYVDYRQRPQAASQFTVVVHTPANPASVIATARGILHDLDPNMSPRFSTLFQVYSASLDARRFSLTLIFFFSLTALLLAVAGIYGVISYSVAQRTREIGVRMALGATSSEVLLTVLRSAAITSVIGISAGLLGSFVVTRWRRSQLFEVSSTGPLTLLGVSVLLALVALAASWLPACRATQIDPSTALRTE